MPAHDVPARLPEPDEDWQQHYHTLLACRSHERLDLDAADNRTRRWLDQQIEQLRLDAPPTERRVALADLGITADTATRIEALLLSELDWWVADHGTALVPQTATSRDVGGRPYPLGRQVKEARIAYRRGSLSPLLEAELPRRPGWAWWGHGEATWDRHLALLRDHVRDHDTLPPLGSATYAWLMRQRGKIDALPPERAELLRAIPGALVSRDTRVPDFVAAARRWLAEDAPDRTMQHLRYAATVEIDDDAYPLGRRAAYYRQRFAGRQGVHPLPPEEIRAIEALPGWDWGTLRRSRRRPSPAPGSDRRQGQQ